MSNMQSLLKQYESNPFEYMRLARITKVIATEEDLANLPVKDLGKSYIGSVLVDYIDWGGSYPEPIQITFPFFSNPVLNPTDQLNPVGGVVVEGSAYGFMGMPSVGDMVILGFRYSQKPVIVGYLSQSYYQQISTATDKKRSWGNVRSIVSGEFSWKSKQQFEVYLDRAGAGHFIFYKQPADVTKTPPVDITKDPSKIANNKLGELTLGVTYNDSFTTKNVSTTGNPIVAKLSLPDSGSWQVDSVGNVEATVKKSTTMVVNGNVTMSIDEDGNVALSQLNGAAINITAAGAITIVPKSGQTADIGDSGLEPIPLGTSLRTAVNSIVTTVNALITLFNSHTHGGVSAGGSSTTGPSGSASAATPVPSSVLSATGRIGS